MIYFDNSATTKNKPREVIDAMNSYLLDVGVSPGRGSYSLGIEASRMLYNSRVTVGNHFGLSRPDRVLFTKNSTEAINFLFNGILLEGDHVIITCYEHNAVLRPLQTMCNNGIIELTIINREDLESSTDCIIKKYVKSNTRLFASTLASNLTGRVIFNRSWTKELKKHGVITFVDASQGAGKISVNLKDDGIDFLAFTGHKDLYGVPGVGGLCCESQISIKPLIQGGTGIHGDNYVNPDVFPEGYEAGTLNMPGIWALKTGIEYVESHFNEIKEKENSLMEYLMSKLNCIDKINIYDKDYNRVPTCCFTIDGQPTDQLVYKLDQKGICVRGGIHCAILAHEALGTVDTGAVRISLNYTNTIEEIDQLVDILMN